MYAIANGVDPNIFEAQIQQESGFDPNALNQGSGASGIAQLMPATAAQPGYGINPADPSDPTDSLRFAAQYMKAMLTQTGGDYRRALAAYNAGPGNEASGAAANFPETQNYVNSILSASGGGGGGGKLMARIPPNASNLRQDPGAGHYDENGNWIPDDPSAGNYVPDPTLPTSGNGGNSVGADSTPPTTPLPYGVTVHDAGDRLIFVDANGNVVGTQPKGLTPVQSNPVQQVHTTERVVDPQQIAVDKRNADIVAAHNAATEAAARQQNQNTFTDAMSGRSLDAYKNLQDITSNPRNFMMNFFANRGQTPPGDAGNYANTSTPQSAVTPYDQYLPNFLSQFSGLQGGATNANANAMSFPTGMPGDGPAGPTYAQPQVSRPHPQPDGVAPWALGNPANMNPHVGPITASGPMTQTFANPNGGFTGGRTTTDMPGGAPGQVFRGVGNQGPAFGIAFNDHADAPITGTPGALDQPVQQRPRSMAQGGSIHVSAPAFLTDAYSGRHLAIAGEAGPENVHFSGQAIKDPDAAPQYVNPPIPTADTSPPSPPDPQPEWGPAPGAGSGPLPSTGPFAPPAPAASPWYGPAPGTGSGPLTPEQVAQMTAGIKAPPVRDVPPSPTGITTPTPQPPYTPPPPNQPGDPFGPAPAGPLPLPMTPSAPVTPPTPPTPPTLVDPPPAPMPSGLVPPPTPNPSFKPPLPGFLPGGGNPPTSGTANPNVNPGFTPSDQYNQFTSGINEGAGGVNAYDATYQNAAGVPGQNPLQDLLAHGKLPPFLQRMFDQYRGNAANGTNTPQQTNLPRGVPLLSKLAYNQLSPSELDAFHSYLSSYGVDPKDYEQMVNNASPHPEQSGQYKAPQFEWAKQ